MLEDLGLNPGYVLFQAAGIGISLNPLSLPPDILFLWYIYNKSPPCLFISIFSDAFEFQTRFSHITSFKFHQGCMYQRIHLNTPSQGDLSR